MFNLCFCFCFWLFLRPVDARGNLISLRNVADMQEPPEPALLIAAVEAGDTSTLEFVLKKWPEKVSQSTVVHCIGMDEVLAHYACTFEISDLHFHFQ